MNRYYKLDSRKVTYGEYWNVVRSPMVIVPWVAKLLNIPIKFAAGLPDFESVRDLEVPEAEFSARARQKLQPLLDKCLSMGFQSPRFFTYENMRRDLRTSFIAMLHESGATVRLMHTIAANVQPPKEKLLVVLLSELTDGTYFCTSSQRKQFISQPRLVANRLVGAGPERLLESHLKRLEEYQYRTPAKRIRSTEELDDLWNRYERSSREFGMERGRYVWMTPEEVAKEQQGMAEAQTMAAAAGSTENTDVMLALHRLQTGKSGWTGLIALFVVSLFLFVAVGSRRWSWDYLTILLGVLFVHELGHYLAMRAFNYRNVRMLFIPFFGAAVMGQNYNVAGWKKVVVSLMGPLPGIVLGIIIGVAGLVLHQPLMVKVALVSLLLNGSNLLPVLPLDGGWVFHTLIFSRHPLLDTAFRVVAVFALFIGGAFIHSKVLMYVCIPMAISIPVAYRTARIAEQLKQGGLPPVSPEEQNIPPATANTIISAIKAATTRPQSNKLTAQQTLQVFETINARPPGWAASIGLLFVHACAFGLALVFALVFLVGQRKDLRDIFMNAASMPKHRIACGQVPVWKGVQFNDNSIPSGNLIVATFARETDAATAFQSLTNQLPVDSTLQLFGDTLLLPLPADDEATRTTLVDELQKRTKDVFVDSTNYHAAFSLICVAPNTKAAEAINAELQGYFQTMPDLALVPPWQPHDQRTPAEREANDLARQTYLHLQAVDYQTATNAELNTLAEQVGAAERIGDSARITSLRDQITALNKKLKESAVAEVRAGVDGPVDTNVVDLYLTLTADETLTNAAASSAIRNQLAQKLGRLDAASLQVGADRWAARFGNVSREGLYIHLNFVSFNRLDQGSAALTAWLCDQGCIGLRYEFQAGLGTYGGEGDD
ncbi:MAG TPA: site-2 protease family protein [Candidatus Acidoferrum sp.]|nr:site-2 protease family protein [Candidatus Acidoferrum sp.]